MSYQWVTNVKAHQRKSKHKIPLPRETVQLHPLSSAAAAAALADFPPPSSSKLLITKKSNFDELDPLTRMMEAENSLDLIAAPTISSNTRTSSSAGSKSKLRDNFEPWSVKKHAILSKFTTGEKLSLTTSIYSSTSNLSVSSGNLEGIVGVGGTTGEIRGVSEKVLHRLEQLDSDSGGAKQFFGGLTQDEYIQKITQLDVQLTAAWNADLRVNSLKIAIQCCKLLTDTSVIYFYPSKFVIITDILDKFGELVYSRLEGKQSDITSAEVVKETCKNWFYKVGSIRELLPRMLIELAILKSSCFINSSPDYGRVLSRLLRSMWGIGDPTVSIYMRCYLCRIGMDLVPQDKELYMQCFQDLLLLHDQVLEHFRNSIPLAQAKVQLDTFVSVLNPAVEYILQCLVHRGEHLHYTLQLVGNIPLFWKSVLMSSLLHTFPPAFIAEECTTILEMILSLESQSTSTNLGPILQNFGLCLILQEPERIRVHQIWTSIWPQIRKLQLIGVSKDDYLSCCGVWVEFMVKHFGIETVAEFLEDILSHISYRDVEVYSGKLGGIVEKTVTFSTDIRVLLTLDPFVKLISMLNSDVTKNVLGVFLSKHPEPQGDSLLVNTLMNLASNLHDSVDALTPIDEIKQIGSLISQLILRVDFSPDYEKQLQFYDEARGAFTNIDSILAQLVQCVCTLGMRVCSLVDGHHTKRTQGFLSACIAYGFITIPSLESPLAQIQLYSLVAQVAYANGCLSQGEACLKAAITAIGESGGDLTGSGEGQATCVEFVSNLLSILLAVPDHPKEPVLYLLRGLLSIDFQSSTISPFIYIKGLSLLGAYAQEVYPYAFDSVDANNALYGGSQDFIHEIHSFGSSLLNNILRWVKRFGEEGQGKKQSQICLDLFLEILNWAELESMGNLALKLWDSATGTNSMVDSKYTARILKSLHRRKSVQSLNLTKKIDSKSQ